MTQKDIPPGPSALDRQLVAFRELVRGELARLAYMAPWEYRVAKVRAPSAQEPRVLLDVTSTTTDMPDLIKCPLRRSMFGGYAIPKVGSSVVVMFLNGDPTKYYADSLDPISDVDIAQVLAASKIRLGASGSAAAARKGDTVHGGFILVSGGGTIIPPSTAPGAHLCYPATPAGLSAAQTDQGANPGSGILALGSITDITAGFGTVTGGSSKTEIE